MAITAILGGIQALSSLSGAITGISKAIADARIAAVNAKTEQDRIAANEKIKQLETERDALITDMTTQANVVQTTLEQTGETMRLELLQENRHWFFTGWRPGAGWLFDVFSAAFGVLLVIATVIALRGNKFPLNTMVEAWPAYLALLGPLGLMVGVYVIGRSTEKAVVNKAVVQEKKK